MSKTMATRRSVERFCAACGNPFQAVVSEIKRGKGRTCSRSCAASLATKNTDRSGPRNNNWKGGREITKEVLLERKNRYIERHPQKHEAHLAVRNAVRNGDLERQACFCGAVAEAHHEDYSKPLEVTWLCRYHHRERHAELRNAPPSLTPFPPTHTQG